MAAQLVNARRIGAEGGIEGLNGVEMGQGGLIPLCSCGIVHVKSGRTVPNAVDAECDMAGLDGAKTGQGGLIPLWPCAIVGIGGGRVVPNVPLSPRIYLPSRLDGELAICPPASSSYTASSSPLIDARACFDAGDHGFWRSGVGVAGEGNEEVEREASTLYSHERQTAGKGRRQKE